LKCINVNNFSDEKPPDNVLFVCKLNPVTTDEDLEMIFSQCGEIVECEVIRDRRTKASLQYAFIEFATVSLLIDSP
jgi:peptidyl-prolyl cis-trans isomerase-like 4